MLLRMFQRLLYKNKSYPIRISIDVIITSGIIVISNEWPSIFKSEKLPNFVWN
jgi:hypothetical protein